ncbi:hypothetical protein DICSQDRAFT_109054 [Dichomitus squalens LYAD-421 SS1]|uniref:Uncharacterized protein n=1 Tax=Dichomitus squalens (strain LYAD-421) TaxID=732165 RepID=R7STL2_DICSQ|nr:uncharacterized protein DICSQDRAFT_109054 [Dichomitus squalens LYAD-421 SS1]EJF59238.1 hypothetical protein DICSQDRAFT_109054 [Dichomitus squalens LYAD-421 SS1]
MPGPRNQKNKKNKKGLKKAPPHAPTPADPAHDASTHHTPTQPHEQIREAASSKSSLKYPLASLPHPPQDTPDGPLVLGYEPLPQLSNYEYLHQQEYDAERFQQVIYHHDPTYPHYSPYPDEPPIPPSLLKVPFIHDPGNGPRVKDIRAFLASKLASPPSLDDPLCGEFADDAVLQMLCTVLPEETATILWYNKSRVTARVCPACQRLYRLGDVLPDHLAGEDARAVQDAPPSPYLAREQELSGLCSPVCFILASYNYPGAIRSTWGRMAEELDDATWDLLDGPGQQANDMGLGMLLKMTRCHDLGLGQLFFPELDMDSDGTAHEEGDEDVKWVGEAEGKVEGVALPTDRAEEKGVVEVMERLRVEDVSAVPVPVS